MDLATYQSRPVSEKGILARVGASKRLLGWVLHSGSVYKITGFDCLVIDSVEEAGVQLAAAIDLASVTAGKYFHDRTAKVLYLRTSGSVNPNGVFIALNFPYFFSDKGFILPHDLDQGFDVHWMPLVESAGPFTTKSDQQNQLGMVVTGGGTLTLKNWQEFWRPIFDKVYFEKKRVEIYAYSSDLAPTDARVLFKGVTVGKSYDTNKVSLTLKDLFEVFKATVPLEDLGSIPGSRIPDSLKTAKQRKVYGYVKGHRLVSIDQVLDEGYPIVGTVSVTAGSTTLSGTGTEFLRQLSKDDELIIGDDENSVTVEALGLTEEWTFAIPPTSAAGQGHYVAFENQAGDTFAVWLDIDTNGTQPTGAAYTAASTKKKVQIQSGNTAVQNAARFADDAGSLTGISVIDNLDGTVTLVQRKPGPVSNPVPHNANDSGSGSIGVTVEHNGIQFSDLYLVLSEAYEGISKTNVTARVKPSHPKRYANREFFVAGHALREPSTTVTSAVLPSLIRVASAADLRPGDTLNVGGELTQVRRVSGNLIKLETALLAIPIVGTSVVRPSISAVYLGSRKLVADRDFVYSASTGRLTLDDLAEFNVAPVRTISGSVKFTSGSLIVTGVDTEFTNEVKKGDWIRALGKSDYFEVLDVPSDTELILRTAATYSTTTGARLKSPEVYDEESSVLSCDLIGATEDGTTGGALLKTAPQIVKELLSQVGLGADLEDGSFATAKSEIQELVGVVVPEEFSESKAPAVRDVVNKINRSVFGTVIQNEDFNLEYISVSPRRPSDLARFVEADMLSLSVRTDSSRIVARAEVNYQRKEYDFASAGASFLKQTAENEDAKFLAKSEEVFTLESLLFEEEAARQMASRWAFLLSVASTVIKFTTKMQGVDVAVGDPVEISHERLFNRIGSQDRRFVSAVQEVQKNHKEVSISVENLANAFARCATITEDDALDFSEADERERAISGYITDDYGMQSNDPDTAGVNLIW